MILRYHATARQVIEAAEYYRHQHSGLGDAFLAEVDAAVAAIVANPLRFEEVRPGIRRCLLRRFPYGIYFRMPDEHTVRIIVVRHHRRRPGLGMRRK